MVSMTRGSLGYIIVVILTSSHHLVLCGPPFDFPRDAGALKVATGVKVGPVVLFLNAFTRVYFKRNAAWSSNHLKS